MEASSSFNLNSPNFNGDIYFKQLLKVIFIHAIYSFFQFLRILRTFSFQECTLRQLMDKENEIVREAQTLNSEMQTLVYENYNKFISATETIRKVSAYRSKLPVQKCNSK